ncbi:hypothetical protein EUX98_g9556 [Antrodiella citrinella]|uniref:Uncharacterized protein n=1 Tax=Antrodiella citrinella TaxID=2447956 RepID=A0A4S4LR46_9APHY|nr:hypothetical protein EUX98_g9556 [Antrodiella citrinella]
MWLLATIRQLLTSHQKAARRQTKFAIPTPTGTLPQPVPPPIHSRAHQRAMHGQMSQAHSEMLARIRHPIATVSTGFTFEEMLRFPNNNSNPNLMEKLRQQCQSMPSDNEHVISYSTRYVTTDNPPKTVLVYLGYSPELEHPSQAAQSVQSGPSQDNHQSDESLRDHPDLASLRPASNLTDPEHQNKQKKKPRKRKGKQNVRLESDSDEEDDSADQEATAARVPSNLGQLLSLADQYKNRSYLDMVKKERAQGRRSRSQGLTVSWAYHSELTTHPPTQIHPSIPPLKNIPIWYIYGLLG